MRCRSAFYIRRAAPGAAENLPDLGAMLAEYYQLRGWDSEGRPAGANQFPSESVFVSSRVSGWRRMNKIRLRQESKGESEK